MISTGFRECRRFLTRALAIHTLRGERLRLLSESCDLFNETYDRYRFPLYILEVHAANYHERLLIVIMSRNTILFVAVALYFLWNQSGGRVEFDPGVLAPNEPVQVNIANPTSFSHKEVTIQPMAHFDIKAKVLGKERYVMDSTSDISNYDFALGWGSMSDQQIVDQIDIHQSGRWYYWHSDHFVLPTEEIVKSSANMHMIHKNDEIKDKLANVREGQIVHIKGYLVNATYPNGGEWNSSLMREDTGGGACEVVFVEEVSVLL